MKEERYEESTKFIITHFPPQLSDTCLVKRVSENHRIGETEGETV